MKKASKMFNLAFSQNQLEEENTQTINFDKTQYLKINNNIRVRKQINAIIFHESVSTFNEK